MLLGTVSFAGQIPTFLFAPFAGVWIDRLNRRQVLVWTQTASMLQSLALAALTLSGHINIPLILILSVTQGIINGFDMPGRQSFMVQMVDDRADLGNAIAINSSMVNIARLIGPSLAGMLIAVTSEGWCFLVDGISYIAVIASLLAMRLQRAAGQAPPASMAHELHEGWTYVTGFLPVRTILMLFAVVSLMGMPFVVLMPIFAARVLHGGPHTLGFLMGAMGVGALASALSLAARKSVRGLIRMIPIAAVVFGIGLIGFGLSHWFWLSMIMVLVAGMGMMQGMAASNTIIQTLVSEDKRGRVMSFYTMAFMGMAPFGSLLAGSMASAFGAPIDRHRHWSGRPARRGMVLHPPARHPRNHPPHLSRDGHSPPGRRNSIMTDIRFQARPKTYRHRRHRSAKRNHRLARRLAGGKARRRQRCAPARRRARSAGAQPVLVHVGGSPDGADRLHQPTDAPCAQRRVPARLDGADPRARPPAQRPRRLQAPVGRLLRHRPRPAAPPPRPHFNCSLWNRHRSRRRKHRPRRLRARLRARLRLRRHDRHEPRGHANSIERIFPRIGRVRTTEQIIAASAGRGNQLCSVLERHAQSCSPPSTRS